MDVLSPRGGAVILQARDLSLPLDLGKMAAGRRVELEIGFGNGEYTVHYARSHPEALLFGIEADFACVARCARRAAGLDNLKILRADARFMMRELFRDGALDRVTMNFPCPWPKRRHADRRVTARDFSDSLAAVLREGGVFELVTDDADYANEAQERLGAHPALEAQPVQVNPPRPVTTKYERKWLAEGKSIYRLLFIRASGGFTVSRRTWEGEGMTHITERPATEAFMASLSGVSGQEGTASAWAFGRHYEGGGVFLLETFSDDDGFAQHYYIRVAPRGDEGASVHLDKTANAFLTPAVRGALRDVAGRLAAQTGMA